MSGRRLLTLVRREVRATLRDPFTLAVLVAVPLVALLVFGTVLSTEARGLVVGVYDADGSAASRRLVAELGAGGLFEVQGYGSRRRLDEALVAGEVDAALVIPPGTERAASRGADGGRPAEIRVHYDGVETVLAGNAEAFLGAIVSRLDLGRGGPPGSEPRLQPVVQALSNPRLDGVPFMVAGTFGFVLSFLTTLITAVSIVNERVAGTFEQLRVTPATGLEILLGKILPLGAVFAFDVVAMTLVAGAVLDVWPAGSPVFFFAVSTAYVLVSLSLGLIFSATSQTPAEAVQKTVLFSVPLVQLSGFVFPIRNMPRVVAWVAELLPATHYIRVTRAIYLRGEGPATLWPELLWLAGFGVALVAIALRSIEARR